MNAYQTQLDIGDTEDVKSVTRVLEYGGGVVYEVLVKCLVEIERLDDADGAPQYQVRLVDPNDGESIYSAIFDSYAEALADAEEFEDESESWSSEWDAIVAEYRDAEIFSVSNGGQCGSCGRHYTSGLQAVVNHRAETVSFGYFARTFCCASAESRFGGLSGCERTVDFTDLSKDEAESFDLDFDEISRNSDELDDDDEDDAENDEADEVA